MASSNDDDGTLPVYTPVVCPTCQSTYQPPTSPPPKRTKPRKRYSFNTAPLFVLATIIFIVLWARAITKPFEDGDEMPFIWLFCWLVSTASMCCLVATEKFVVSWTW